MNIDTEQYIERLQTKKPEFKSERAELISKFVVALNKEREGTKYPPVTAKRINIQLARLGNGELYMFYKECENYQGAFGRRFFGGFKEQVWKHS